MFVDDVVAVKHFSCLVAGQQHGDALRDAGPNQVPRRRAPAIVEESMGKPGLAAGVAEGRAPDPYRYPIAVEHPRVLRLSPFMSPLEHELQRR